jgi:hypothetical protein
MPKSLFKIAGVVLVATAGAAVADTTTVQCDGFLVTLEEEATMGIQENAGTGAAFEKAVCDAASQLPISQYKDPTRVNVTVEPSGNEYMVLVQQKNMGN